MNNWLYKKREIRTINDMPQETYGFIYLTVHTPTGKQYLGKKSLYHNVKKKLTKKELAEQTGPGRKPTTVTVKNPALLADVKVGEQVKVIYYDAMAASITSPKKK